MSENLLMRGAAVAEWKDYKDILTERKGGGRNNCNRAAN